MLFVKYFLLFAGFCLLVACCILFIPENTYFSKAADRAQADTLILTLVFIIPLIFVPFIFPKRLLKFYIGFVVAGFVGYLGSNYFRKKKTSSELLTNAISTRAVVKEKFYRTGGKGSGYWEFYCMFQHHNKDYRTFYEYDSKNKIHVGDSLVVRYLERNPEISEIVMPGNH